MVGITFCCRFLCTADLLLAPRILVCYLFKIIRYHVHNFVNDRYMIFLSIGVAMEMGTDTETDNMGPKTEVTIIHTFLNTN